MPETTIKPTPLPSLRVTRHHIPPHGLIPNSAATSKPLLIYHSCLLSSSSSPSSHPGLSPSAVEAHLTRIGAVSPQWRYTMYPMTHFHSTTHEVLVVTSGRARLCFGGEGNPGKVEDVVQGGDVVVVPAGVGHRLLEDLSGGKEEGEEGGAGERGGEGGGQVKRFEMVGAYPPGKEWDMCYGRPGEEGKVERIGELEWFARDPIYGESGPVLGI